MISLVNDETLFNEFDTLDLNVQTVDQEIKSNPNKLILQTYSPSNKND